MRKILLASAGIIISTGTGYAACIPTPSCSSLGYESSSSCEGGIKCPFGNAWNCTLVNKITEIEKVIEKNSIINNNCQVGHIYYSDKTCSLSLDSSKTPIGIVIYVDGQGHGQAMALKSIGQYTWGGYGTDIQNLNNFDNFENAGNDFNSCSNTEKIIAAGNKSKYPAAWAAQEYKTLGTETGDWCLPAAGIFTSYYNNKQLVNSGIIKVGGSQIRTDLPLWSSTENSAGGAWYSDFSSKGLTGLTYDYYYTKDRNYEVRPVLEF